MATPAPLFLLLGHGREKAIEFEDRAVLPPGYTLVTLVEHGTVSMSDEVCKSLQMFSEPEYQAILSNPRENKAKLEAMLGKTINVYTEGFKVPSLEIRPLANWDAQGRFTKIMRSGVHRFPIPPSDRTQFHSNNLNFEQQVLLHFPGQNAEIARCFPYMFYTKRPILKEELVPILYEHSLYPTVEEASALIGKSFEFVKYTFQTPVLKLMERLGPGVYYFVICRDVNLQLGEYQTFFMFTLDKEEIEALPEGFRERYQRELTELKMRCDAVGDLVEKIRTFLAGLDALSDDVLAVAWKLYGAEEITKAELLTKFPDYRAFVAKATRIRRTSHHQQGRGRSARCRQSSRRRTIRRR